MVEGDQSVKSQEPEGTASTYDAVGLGAGGGGGASPPDNNAHHPPPSILNGADKDAVLNKLSIPRNLPSIVDIKRAMPPHVFDPKVSTSMYYAVKDMVLVALVFFLSERLWASGVFPGWSLLVLLPCYWLLQGTLFTAVFVVGHDAGHSSFSHHDWLNDAVGNVLHTFLLCPYYCWKVTHKQHHKNTGNIDRDEVYYPIREKDNFGGYTLPGFGLGMGWFAYLVMGYGPRAVNHLNPFNPMLRRYAPACILSLALCAGWAAVLYQYALSAGVCRLLIHFVVPDFIFATYMVVITFLHHTEEDIPWYDDSLWEYVRGQLSSVDRHYGWCHGIIHNIGTHQIHHLFSKVPHYHLEEATAVFRQKFPKLVQVRGGPILPAFARMFKKYVAQSVVPDTARVHLYK